MIRYRKGPCPPSLTAHAATPGADFDGLDKQPLRDALGRDQRALCAYCQERILPTPPVAATATDRATKIEHLIARNDPQEGTANELRWENLVGVCRGVTLGSRHCDTRRGDAPPERQRLQLCPIDGRGLDPRLTLRYRRGGELEPSDELDEAARASVARDLELLGLNAPFLVRNRKAALDALEQRLKPTFSVASLRAELALLDAGNLARVHTEALRDYLFRKLRRHGVALTPGR